MWELLNLLYTICINFSLLVVETFIPGLKNLFKDCI